MGTSTSVYQLYKPNPDPVTGDNINVATDINDNMDRIEAALVADDTVLNGHENRLNIIEGAWTDWTPTLLTTSYSLGNGSVKGRYIKVGKTVNFWAQINFGSTTAIGTGTLMFALPVAVYNATGTDEQVTGITFLIDTGMASPNIVHGVGLIFPDTNANGIQMYRASQSTIGDDDVTAVGSYTWAASTKFRWGGTYEAA